MIDELIVHIGMHKTGSSSIQETFSKKEFSELEYLKVSKGSGYPNLSGFVSTAFLNAPERYHTHVKNGRTRTEVKLLQERYLKELSEVLRGCRSKRALISAEDLSAPNWSLSERRNFLDFISRFTRSVRVIGYVRPPAGFMASAFQQILKGGAMLSLDNPNLWPFYRERFEPWIDLLGKDRVELVLFDKNSLLKGDVVLDFAERLGVTLAPSEIFRVNESLSIEATALLYIFRKYQKKEPYNQYSGDNNRLMTALYKIGAHKFCFSYDLTSSFIKRNQMDMNWINEQLETPVQDNSREKDFMIDSEQALYELACENRRELWQAIEGETGAPMEESGAAELIDRMRVAFSSDSLVHCPNHSGRGSSASHMFSEFQNPQLTPAEILRQAAGLFAQVEPKVAEGLRMSATRAERKMAQNREALLKENSSSQDKGQ